MTGTTSGQHWRCATAADHNYGTQEKIIARSNPNQSPRAHRKRSRGYHGYTTLAQVESEADHGNVAVRASVLTGHRITSSAWKRSVGGIVIPSPLAVFRLMTNSNFMGCSTGSSAGLAPFRILST